jgi:hypothetical protein
MFDLGPLLRAHEHLGQRQSATEARKHAPVLGAPIAPCSHLGDTNQARVQQPADLLVRLETPAALSAL